MHTCGPILSGYIGLSAAEAGARDSRLSQAHVEEVQQWKVAQSVRYLFVAGAILAQAILAQAILAQAILAQAILAQVSVVHTQRQVVLFFCCHGVCSARWFVVDGESWRLPMVGCECCGDLDRQQ